jgi:hypothetical protein
MSNNKKTTVSLGGGYRSRKSTELYTPETAPINYQNSESPKEQKPSVPHITLEPDVPFKELNIEKAFLESFSPVFIQGQYPLKGRVNLKMRQIIEIIIQNTGGYHVRVHPSAKNTLFDIIKYGDSTLLGRKISEYERKVILNILSSDNI